VNFQPTQAKQKQKNLPQNLIKSWDVTLLDWLGRTQNTKQFSLVWIFAKVGFDWIGLSIDFRQNI
jgi:hypothetical protein